VTVGGLRMGYGAADVLRGVTLRRRRGEVLAGRMARRESGSAVSARRDRAPRQIR
jgi:hypothetical protein